MDAEQLSKLMRSDQQGPQSVKEQDILEKDFVNKRSQLLSDTLRKLSFDCVKACSLVSGAKDEVPSVDFSENEERCL